jgi:chemotaxis protein histidine kinase CheA
MSEGEVRIRFSAEGNDVLLQALRDAQERLEEMREAGIQTDEQFKEYKQTLREVISAKRDLKREVEVTNESLYDSVKVMHDLGSIFRTVSGVITQYNVAQIRIEEATKSLNDAQNRLIDAQNRYNEVVSESFESTSAYQSGIEAINRAMESEKEANEKVQEAEQRLAEVREEATAEANDKIAQLQERYNQLLREEEGLGEDLQRAELSRERTQLRIKELQEKLNELMAKGKEGTDEYIKTQIDLQEAQLDLQDQEKKIAELQEKLATQPERLSEAQKKLAEDIKKVEDEKTKKIQEAEKEVEKAREEAEKKHEEVAKEQEKLNKEQADWEKKHAEEVKKASDDVVKAREDVEKANRQLSEAEKTLTTQMLTFALYGVPQVLTSMTHLMKDSVLLTESFNAVSMQGVGGLITSLKAIPTAMATLFTNPYTLAIMGAIALIIGLKEAWDRNLGGIQDKFKSFEDALHSGWNTLVSTLKDAWEKYGAPAFESLKEAFAPVIEALNQLWKAVFEPFIDWLKPIATDFLKGVLYGAVILLSGVFQGLAISIKVVYDAFKMFIDFVRGAIDVVKSVVDWFEKLIGKSNEAKTATQSATTTTPSAGWQATAYSGHFQTGGLVPTTGLYQLEKGEYVLTPSTLKDILNITGQGMITQNTLIEMAKQAKQTVTNRTIAVLPEPMPLPKGEEGEEGGAVSPAPTVKLSIPSISVPTSIQNISSIGERYSGLAKMESVSTASGGGKNVEIRISSPLINVQGHMDEKLAKQVSEYILREMRRIVA